MRRILAAYQFAVAVGLAMLFIDMAMAGASKAGQAAWIIVVAGLLSATFIWGYFAYAIEEWGDFTPQSWQYMAVFPLAYMIIFFAVTALSLLGEGSINMAVWAAFLASAGLILYTSRNIPLHLSSGDPLGDIMAGVRLLPLALAAGLPGFWLALAAYEALRAAARRAWLMAISITASILLATLAPWTISTGSITGEASLQYTGVEVLAWPGIIAWEELISRFLLPAVGPLANYMFVVLHVPSRTLDALTLAPAIVAVISMATRWLTDVYRKHGLVGSIAAHAVYNGMISWVVGLVYYPVTTIASLAALAGLYIYAWSSGKL